ncbi:hypothetical protein ECFRIK1985_4931, partial [Escherichia coli FRIK1985]
MARQVVALE